MVEAAGHFNLVAGNAEVKATQMDVLWSAAAKPRRAARLVKRLVGAESRVPIDPAECLCRISHVFRRKTSQLRVERYYQFEHRRFYVLLEKVLAGLKPLAAVV